MDKKDLLRDRYLQLWLNVTDTKPQCKFHLYGGTVVQGELIATDSENNRFRVNQLESPLGIYNKVIVRGTDVDWIEWKI
ncbi:uncharacterized protein BX663DRAFT_497061 [Cokeromyces recurvatus]|uniref:uncharacterized protein n=1 Tax=Cokeromyces recurvatus TaxID=90255 RepID=UPI00221EDBA7|nr:uncharacterized protein BX663DRAFT_497061 [Cokeromyces recurvatus]KAI7906605.1 hypothetical protein BX663DRAFT_497061 [Cokeromyces recurvatus]